MQLSRELESRRFGIVVAARLLRRGQAAALGRLNDRRHNLIGRQARDSPVSHLCCNWPEVSANKRGIRRRVRSVLSSRVAQPANTPKQEQRGLTACLCCTKPSVLLLDLILQSTTIYAVSTWILHQDPGFFIEEIGSWRKKSKVVLLQSAASAPACCEYSHC
jgi:hypothetical protein